MEVYNHKTKEHETASIEVVNFINEIISLYYKYDLSISHEDRGGTFVIEKNNNSNIEMIKESNVSF